MVSKFPEYVQLADMEIHIAPGAHVTIRPYGATTEGNIPLLPCHLVLTQTQARTLAQDLIDAADQSSEESKESRN